MFATLVRWFRSRQNAAREARLEREYVAFLATLPGPRLETPHVVTPAKEWTADEVAVMDDLFAVWRR